MGNPRWRACALGLLWLFHASSPVASETRAYRDWTVRLPVSNDERSCTLISTPTRVDTFATGRGDTFAAFTRNRQDGANSTFSIVAGFGYEPNSPVMVIIDQTRFKLEPDGDIAWTDDPERVGKIIDALRRGTKMTVYAKTSAGKVTIDAYSLLGFGEAHTALSEKCRPARVATVRPPPRATGPITGKSTSRTGTAFFVSDTGHLLTNAHVIQGCQDIVISRPTKATLSAFVVATDEKKDLALLQASEPSTGVALFRGDDLPQIGETVVIYGFPLSGVLASTGNLVTGTLSALAGMSNNPIHYQITAPIQQGNSGGPVLDSNGQVMGVVVGKLNAMKAAQLLGDLPQNINFAIKGWAAVAFLEANGVRPLYGSDVSPMSVVEAATLAQTFTVHVRCIGAPN